MLKDKSESVKVVMRCRPLTPKEMEDQRECIVNVDMDVGSIQVYNPQNIKELKNFTFDHTYDWRATQQLIFEQTALPILESIMEGYNGTIFAYGQTGTGKTYTMEGNDNDTDKGIIPRSIDWIFNKHFFLFFINAIKKSNFIFEFFRFAITKIETTKHFQQIIIRKK